MLFIFSHTKTRRYKDGIRTKYCAKKAL